MIFGTFPFP